MTTFTDDTREEIALFIRDENRQAKREVAVVRVPSDHPSKWDIRHAHLNELLTDYELCSR